MKKELKWILGLIALIIVIGSAYLLYDNFSKDYVPETLVETSQGSISEAESGSQSESMASSESEKENTASEDNAEAEPIMAPDFTVYDKDGNDIRLSDFIGKPVIVNFWASWCGPCKNEMPDFEEAYKNLGDDIVFMMVNLTDGTRETQSIAEEFISGTGYTFPIYFDLLSDAANTYSVYSIPTTFFINSDGTVAAYARGMINAETLQKGIDMMN